MSLTFKDNPITNRKTSNCYRCGKRIKEVKLCDYGVSILSLCNKEMCENCANLVGDDTHVCDEHNYEVMIRKATKLRKKLKEFEEIE